MPNKLHVIFGTGPVGMAVMDELQARDVRVRMVNRSGKTSEPLPEGVELVSGDATNKTFAAGAAEGAAVVYNAMNPGGYELWETLIMPLWEGVVHAAAAHGAKLVSIDNLYMYGDTDGEPIHEEMPFAAQTKKGKIRAQANRYMMDAHGENGAQVVVAHASDFFGPRVDGSMMGGDIVVRPALAGKAAQVLGKPDMPHSYTYMPDVGRALVTLALDDNAYGQRWHIPSLEPLPTREYVERIYAAAGNPVKIQNPPKWMVRALGWFNPTVGELVEMLYEFEKPFIIDSHKFEAAYGWGAADVDDAIQTTVAWYQKNTV